MSSAALRTRRGRRGSRAVAAFVVVLSILAVAPAHAATAIGLGTAGSFAVLAGSGITNTGATVIAGDVGTFPTPSRTGFDTVVLAGVDHGGDAVTQQAKEDLTTAYDQAAASAPANQVATELGGTTLTPGVYHGETLAITGRLTLDTLGDPQAVFVFQTDSTFITASASEVVVLGGQVACNVFWQVGSSATLGSDSRLVGSVLAATSITANDGAVIEGRLLASTGAVTLQRNTITARVCASGAGGAAADPATTTPPTSAPAPAATQGATTVPAVVDSGSAAGAPGLPVAPPTAGGAVTATPAPAVGRPTGGSASGAPTLPRTGPTDALPLVGSLAIATGLLLVRIGTPRVPLRHAVRPRHLAPRSHR